ncbi:MAG: LysM peptidoglycan-binding domain-containing protein [Actinomycetota bacterium]|nr:LysM peptidoglycan-binding domain-containing protein [Actinomycetota bacterium]
MLWTVRRLSLVSVASAAIPALLQWSVTVTRDVVAVAAREPAFDDLFVAAARAVVAGCLTWLATGVLLTALADGCGAGRRRLARVAAIVTPRAVSTAVRLACGVALASAPVLVPTTASAVAASADFATCAARRCPPSLHGLPLPDRPPVAVQTRRHHPAASGTAAVRPGDSLWVIAARHLPPVATDAEVAAAWPRWYAANRDRIGPDPDLILAGTRLVVPAGTVPEEPE